MVKMSINFGKNFDDETCRNLFQYFAVRQMTGEDSIRFNELLRDLNSKGFSISRPTLSLHLSHLVEKSMIKRTEHKKQHVSYRFYHENYSGLKENIEKNIKISKNIEKEKATFLSDPIEEQVFFMTNVLMLRILHQVKAEFQAISDPENLFQYQLQIHTYTNLWNRFVEWVTRSYKSSNEIKQKELIRELDSLIKLYMDGMFGESALD